MTTFLLIRHGETEAVGRRLSGREPGVGLTERGREQARELAERLSGLRLHRVISSPLRRTRETASALAEAHDLELETDAGLCEVDFGDWTDHTVAELENRILWRQYHQFRSGIRIPGGEMALEIQTRMIATTERLRGQSPEGAVALVGHGDPIRYAVAFYAGIPLDLAFRVEIDTVSVSAVVVDNHGARVLCVNNTGGLPAL